jgi:Integrase zinc binding domain
MGSSSTFLSLSRLARLVTAPLSPSTFSDYDWPENDTQKNAQLAADDPMPLECTMDSEGLARYQSQAVWIPDGDKALQLRLLIAAHTGPGGHRGITTTEQAMNGFVQWTSMRKDLASFVNSCIHCLSSSTGGTVPRQKAQTLHAEKPNKLLHFDFLYIGHGLKGVDYILVLKDDLSSYCRLIPSSAANAVTTAASLIDWFAPFGIVLDWVSDHGSPFRNVVVRLLREQNYSSHRFTLAYCPWSNGTVEVVNREILRILRALCSELKIPFREWPNLCPGHFEFGNSASSWKSFPLDRHDWPSSRSPSCIHLNLE